MTSAFFSLVYSQQRQSIGTRPMCGIAGSWGVPLDEATRERALAAIAHRGPDAGAWGNYDSVAGPVHLGHRRLSIIDLSDAANQPFEKDGLAVIFNGEIYNYRALRDELIALGVQFRTQSDTEVLLEAYRQWGEQSFRRMRGMFAFAMFDQARQSLLLVRDPFGIKPLYVYRGPRNSLLFASEIKPLAAMGARLEINRDAVAASMIFMFVPETINTYDGIERLPAGSFLRADARGIEVRSYWDAAEALVGDGRPRNPLTIEELRGVLEDSIAAHMTADVPVSTFLSGGLDSSIITVLAKRHNPQLEAYTIRIPEQDVAQEAMPQDVLFARMLAKSEGVKLHEIEVAPDIVEWLPRMMSVLEEPITDPATINVMLICETARAAGAKVLLSGMGADELFGGYRRHQASVLAEPYRKLPVVARAGISGVVGALPVAAFGRGLKTVRWAKRFLSFAGNPSRADAYLRSYSYYDGDELEQVAGKVGRATFEAVRAAHRGIFDRPAHADLQTRMTLTDLYYFLPGLNLTYSDRGSMYASTEVRVPFVDIEVADAAFRLTGAQKTSGKLAKIALKRAAEAWLPREIIYRPKASFGVPLRAWMRGPLSERVHALANNGALVREGYVDGPAVHAMIKAFDDNRVDYSYQLWHLLALDTWLDWASRAGGKS